MNILKALLIVSIVVFLSFTTIYSDLHAQASELRAMPAPITDRGSIVIPEKVFPEGKGVPIPIYVPPVMEGSNAVVRDGWRTVEELKGQETNIAATVLGGAAIFRGDPVEAQKLLNIKTDYKITIQESPQGERRAIIQTSGVDKSVQRIAETIDSRKIIKEEGREVQILNVDRSRKDDPYIAYVSLNPDKKTVDITPKIYPEDKVIIRSIGTVSNIIDILLGKSQDTEIRGKELVNYLTPLFKSGIDIGQLEKMFSDEKVIASMSVTKMDTSASRLEQVKEKIKDIYTYTKEEVLSLPTALDLGMYGLWGIKVPYFELFWPKTVYAPSDHITDDNKLTFVASKENEVLPTSGIYAYRLLLKTKSPYDGVNYPTSDSGNITLFVNWTTGKVYGFSSGDFSPSPSSSAVGVLKGSVDRTNKRIVIVEWGMQTSYRGTNDNNEHARFITAEDFIINLDRNEIKSGSFNVQWWAGNLHAYNTTGTYSGTSQSFNAVPSVTPGNGEVWKGFAVGIHYNPSNSTFDTLYNTSSNDVYVTFRTSDNNVDGQVSVANADSSITELFTFNDYHFVSKDAFGGECFDACGSRVQGFGTTGDSHDYNYISWGKWASELGAPDEKRIFGVGSDWIVGRLTPFADIPTTGSATYSGEVMGSLTNNGTGLFTSLLGTTSLTANFANKTVTGTFDNLKKADSAIWVNQANVNANWGGTNAISGTISGGGKSGNINGAFFGPQAAEVGGNWTLNGGGDQAAGIFGGKR